MGEEGDDGGRVDLRLLYVPFVLVMALDQVHQVPQLPVCLSVLA